MNCYIEFKNKTLLNTNLKSQNSLQSHKRINMNEFNLPYEGKRKNYNEEKQIKPKKTLMLCFSNALC